MMLDTTELDPRDAFICNALGVLCSIAIGLVTLFLALGAGLGSSPDSPVPRAASFLWSIAGYGVAVAIPLSILTSLLRKRVIAWLLAETLIVMTLASVVGVIIHYGKPDIGTRDGNLLYWIAVAVTSACIFGIISRMRHSEATEPGDLA